MSKIYILSQTVQNMNGDQDIIKGVITNKKVAEIWSDKSGVNNFFLEFELNDPEFLNRIAKESEKKQND